MKIIIKNVFKRTDPKNVFVVEIKEEGEKELREGEEKPCEWEKKLYKAYCITPLPNDDYNPSIELPIEQRKLIVISADNQSGLDEIPQDNESDYTIKYPKKVEKTIINFHDKGFDRDDPDDNIYYKKKYKKKTRKTKWSISIKHPLDIKPTEKQPTEKMLKNLKDFLAENHTVEVGDNDQ